MNNRPTRPAQVTPIVGSSASSACSGEDARQADKASAVTQRSGDEVIRDEAQGMMVAMRELGIHGAYKDLSIEGFKVRIDITRQE